MAISREKRIAFLKQRQLFREMEEADIARIADRLDEYHIQAHEQLITHGDRGRTFYFIYSGKVRVWRKVEREEVELAILESGDKFGEEALLFNQPRSASVTALEDCILLTLDIKDFNWMLRTYPVTKLALRAIAESHQQARKMRFTWLHQGEVIHLITRRHPAELIFDLARPFVVLLLAIFFLFLTSLIPGLTTISFIIGFGLVGASVLWSVWEVLDWLNDYFIITNQRVVWLEQILLQSASRQEAPMGAIQSVNVETGFIGRILGFGNVFIRTFTGTGSLRLTKVAQPKQFSNLIEELLMRVREKSDEVQTKLMRKSIRESLGLETTQFSEPPPPAEEPEEEERWVIPFLRTREVRGDVITYHKHWLVLIAKTWLPLLILLGFVALTIVLYLQNLTLAGIEFPLMSTVVVLGGGSVICLGIIGYHYLDWLNDIYKLTKDTIIDSERKPLGREVTKSAPIKNILSIEHAREGILRLLLNYGVVNIVVADTTLSFFDVHNPAQVQQDIFYRQEQLIRDGEAAEAEKNRVQMSEWLKTYHEIWTAEQQSAQEEGDGAEEETSV
jgi:membrane protein YdbS with pleckstrin-like domain